MSLVPPPSTQRGKRRGLSGCVHSMIHREGRGLCFDRVTAAGGAEYVVVSQRMLSAAPPADGDRPSLLHLLKMYTVSRDLSMVVNEKKRHHNQLYKHKIILLFFLKI